MKKGEQRDKMTAIKFKVKCPYEIGDKVKFEKAGKIKGKSKEKYIHNQINTERREYGR